MRSLATYFFPSLALAALNCRPDGPVLPKPSLSSLESSNLLAEAAANLTSSLDDAIAGSINAGWETKNLSFSLAFVSADQKDPGVPLWEYHHLAEANTRGTKEIGRDSQYLIGSISKLISDYVLLQSGVNLDMPVTDHLPKLAGSKFGWEKISLRMLASHLGGAPTNYGFSEFYYLKEVFLSYGLPPIPDSAYPPCGVIALNGGCSQQDFLNGMRNSYPVTAPNERPAYSNIAFTIIFMALENSTGKNYDQLLKELFVEPLGLSNTMPSPGNDSQAVIPPGESTWGADYSFNAPGGGLVSSLSDLSKFTHGILSRDMPMEEAELNAWLKPSSSAGGPSSFVGMPWEIFRPENLTPEHPHTVTIYGKGGGAMAYRSQISVIDEYGVGIVVLTAGPMEAMPLLQDAVLSTFVPVVDAISRVEADTQFGRIFKASQKNVTLSATFDQDVDSLILKSLQRDEKDMVAAIADIWTMTMGGFVAPVVKPIRLFPSALVDTVKLKDGTQVTREVWRLWPNFEWSMESDLPGLGLEAESCFTWTVGDWVHYGSEPIDRVLFYRDESGDIVGFEVPFLRSGILRPE